MTADQVIERCRALAAEPLETAAARWKSAHPGGSVVAAYPVWVPAEIIHAAGMLPVALLGGGTAVELSHADSRFQSFVCSMAKSSLELAFQKRLGGVDAVVFSNICDVARNLASVWARNFPEVHVEYLHLPQNSTSPAAARYAADELRRLAASIERAFGLAVTPDALARSIGTWNALRARLRALYAARIEAPQRISTIELYTVLRAVAQAPAEEAIEWLEALLTALPARPGRPRDRLRVVVEGAFCEQPPLGLLEVLEDTGCYVVEDDLLLGVRWFTADVETDGDPFARLGAAYAERAVASSVRHESRRSRAEGLLEKVRRARADAVIFLPAKFCEPALFDYVLMRRGLEAAGVPHLVVEFEEKMWTFERTRNEVETFVESMLLD